MVEGAVSTLTAWYETRYVQEVRVASEMNQGHRSAKRRGGFRARTRTGTARQPAKGGGRRGGKSNRSGKGREKGAVCRLNRSQRRLSNEY